MYPNNNVKRTRRNELSYFRNDIGIAIASVSDEIRQVFDNKYRLLEDIQVFGADLSKMQNIDHVWLSESLLPKVCDGRSIFAFQSYRYRNIDNVYSHGLKVIDSTKALEILRNQIEMNYGLRETILERHKNKLYERGFTHLLSIKNEYINRIEILLEESLSVQTRIIKANAICKWIDFLQSDLREITLQMRRENFKSECYIKALIARGYYMKLNPNCYTIQQYRKNKRLKEIEARQFKKYKDIFNVCIINNLSGIGGGLNRL